MTSVPFADRHIGPDAAAVATMLATVGQPSLDALVAAAVPDAIRDERPLDLPAALDEPGVTAALRELAPASP
jgi:glycine dehydrogenase